MLSSIRFYLQVPQLSCLSQRNQLHLSQRRITCFALLSLNSK